MENKEFKFGGDLTTIISGPSEVDISDMNFFDDITEPKLDEDIEHGIGEGMSMM